MGTRKDTQKEEEKQRGRRNRTPGVSTHSRVRNILISNVIADGVDKMSGIQISGLPEQPVEGVRLENIRFTSRGGGSCGYGRGSAYTELGFKCFHEFSSFKHGHTFYYS